MEMYGYELEVAHRKMAELEQQAARDGIVKELKEARRKQRLSIWDRLIRLIKAGKRPTRASLKSAYNRQSPSGGSGDE